MRNEKLDIFRGLAMIWVVLVHCLYWLDFFSWQKSFFLIEMPLLFFISGAGNRMSRKKSLRIFYLTRFQRILIPYWIYAVICIAFISLVNIPETIKSFVKLVYSWINPFSFHISSIPYLNYALWFVPVYLLVMLIFPLFEKIHNTHKYIHYLPLIFLLLLVGILNFWENETKILYYTKMLVFYIFFTYLGMFFTEITEKRKTLPALIIVTICLVIMFVLVKFWGLSLDMQRNKFPPNFMFFSFSLGALTILYMLSDTIVHVVKFFKQNVCFDWIFQQYVRFGLTIFLFHPFVFLLLGYMKNTCFARINTEIAFIIIFLLAIPLVAVVAKCFSWIEYGKVFHDSPRICHRLGDSNK
jgi:peptidoglycan/LPS O-acetylase OafA/YrhL